MIKGYFQPSGFNGVLVNEKSDNFLNRFDGVIFDVDGVLVDVRSSFRKAIIETAAFFCRRHLGAKLCRKISPALVKKFKLTPGFNNDWELTYSMILILINYFEKHFKPNQIADFNLFSADYLNEVARLGGGLKAARKVFETRLPSTYRKWYSLIPFSMVKRIFQELYGGVDFCSYLYGFQPQTVKKEGLVNLEKVLVSKELLKRFYPNLGLITGRTKEETSLFLSLSGFKSLFSDEAIIHDRLTENKPHPEPLKRLMEKLGLTQAVYLGDVLDDWLMVEKYCKIKRRKAVLGGIIVPSKREIKFFADQNVDLIATSTENALKFLLERKGSNEKSKN